ncbi:hypothetical protein Tco_0037744 [Tanacetum coccineum]
MQPVAPDYMPRPEHTLSPDYVPGPEHPPYVPEPEYPEYLVPSDVEAPLKDQPLPADASPTALSPGYVVDSDPEEDPEEDHADYPADRGNGDDEPSDDIDDEDEESFEDEGDDEEKDEHLDLANSSAIPVVNHVPSAKDTEAFKTDEARKTVRLEPPMSPSMKACIPEHAAAPTPPLLPPSPLSPWSSPLSQIPSPPLPVSSRPLPLPSPLTTSPTNAGAPLGYRAARIQMRAASPPMLLPSTSHRTDIPEAEMPRQKRACSTTLAPGLEVGESSTAGATRQPGPTLEADAWDEIVEAMMEIAPTTLEGVDQRVTELDTTVRQRTEEFEFEERRHAIEAHVRTLEAQVATLIAQTTSLQTQLTTALGRIATLEARDPEPQDAPAETGSSS